MTKFKSLLFRELKISLKTNIFKALAFICLALFYCVGIYSVKLENEDGVVQIVTVSAIALGLFAVSLNLLEHSGFKSDLKTNWLMYSYTLPVKAKERTVAITVLRYGMILLFMLAGLIFTVIDCHIGGIAFSVSFVTIYMAIFALAQLGTILFDIFVFRVRSIDELNKQQQRLGLFLMGICLLAVLLLKNKILKYFSSDDILPLDKLLDIMDVKMLVLLIPIDIILVIADYFIIKNRLQYAYSFSNVRSKPEIQKKEEISDTHDYPTGFLYKELRQNRFVIVSTTLLPLFTLAVNYMMMYTMCLEYKLTLKEIMMESDASILRYLCIATGVFIASSLISSIFSGDDRKLWAYFTVSTPQGVKRSLYNKYLLAFALNGLYMVISSFAGNLYETVYFAVTGEENGSLTSLNVILFFLLLMICAVDIPFMIRFGQKKGSYIKLAAMLVITTIVIVGFDFLPENIKENLMRFFSNIMEGKTNSVILLAGGIYLWLCLALYVLSYKFSCRLFMKGVDSYDK